ncbi:hypothetical protein COCVIDRAFT_35135 [Bipolaris victoriae FI3]|uniref:Secreted protein n=1 Tax=Bipolaris victoriae (strain FI3) TaxID=930091 RepID=W7ESB7_BIPV3|nr:hypothetical protein COCVIDRAFT_35135 [Bipolaris victoriae FI3]
MYVHVHSLLTYLAMYLCSQVQVCFTYAAHAHDADNDSLALRWTTTRPLRSQIQIALDKNSRPAKWPHPCAHGAATLIIHAFFRTRITSAKWARWEKPAHALTCIHLGCTLPRPPTLSASKWECGTKDSFPWGLLHKTLLPSAKIRPLSSNLHPPLGHPLPTSASPREQPLGYKP